MGTKWHLEGAKSLVFSEFQGLCWNGIEQNLGEEDYGTGHDSAVPYRMILDE